jgi:hypothetical protein
MSYFLFSSGILPQQGPFLILDFLGSERFELQPREEEHHAEEYDTHGAR